MQRRILLSALFGGVALLLASTVWADVPPPPVNQNIGMADVGITSMVEADCRLCHASGVPDRHHLLYDQPIPHGSLVPYPDSDGDGFLDFVYDCLNCHDPNFTIVYDCLACHTSSAHHTTEYALAGNCTSCHGDLVDNMDDGHYIPTYSPSLVTPTPSFGDGLPLNSRGKGAGACDYCHDDGGLQQPAILPNEDLHHSVSDCSWCHALAGEEPIRICEGCHGPDSLHNIQADSPDPDTIGTIVIGGEDWGYGHVGRDGGAGDSDCWGCHGFGMTEGAPASGPLFPTIHSAEPMTVDAGTETTVTLAGSSFTNVAGATHYASDVALTASDGSSVILTPDHLDEASLEFTIPGDLSPGNYELRAVKADIASNLAVISVKPQVIIDEASGRGSVTIHGSGFGGHAEGSGTSVTGTVVTGKGRYKRTTVVEATIVSWSDTAIEAVFDSRPEEVTVNSVFGVATSEVEKGKKDKDKRAKK